MATEFELGFQYRNKRYKDAREGLRRFAANLGKSDITPLMTAAVRKEMDKFLKGVAQALIKRHGGAWPGGTTTNSMSRRSGGVARAIHDSIRTEVSGSEVDGYIGGPGWLTVHEDGTKGAGGKLPDITPKRGDWLTVPLKDALDHRGVPIRAKARDWPDTFVLRAKDGRLFIAQRGKGGKQGLLLYRLKESVAIPARLNMGATLQAGTAFFVDKATEACLRAFVETLDKV